MSAVPKSEDEKTEAEVILGGLTSAEKDEYKEAFRLFDKDGDGHVTVSEIKTVFDALGLRYTVEQITKMVAAQDMDGDLCIDLEEFIVMLRSKKSTSARPKTYDEEIEAAFRVFDIDGDGSITASELSTIMKAIGEDLTEDDVKWMIRAIDEDGDGEIDISEFKAMMNMSPPETASASS